MLFSTKIQCRRCGLVFDDDKAAKGGPEWYPVGEVWVAQAVCACPECGSEEVYDYTGEEGEEDD